MISKLFTDWLLRLKIYVEEIPGSSDVLLIDNCSADQTEGNLPYKKIKINFECNLIMLWNYCNVWKIATQRSQAFSSKVNVMVAGSFLDVLTLMSHSPAYPMDLTFDTPK